MSTPAEAPSDGKRRGRSQARLRRTRCSSPSAGATSFPLTATLEAQPTPYPGTGAEELFDPSLSDWTYDLRPTRELRKGTTYALLIDRGVEPVYGNGATTQRFYGESARTRRCAIVPTPHASPNSSGRFAGGDPVIAFNNPLDPASVNGAVKISPAPAPVKKLVSVPDYQSNVIAIDPYALDPRTDVHRNDRRWCQRRFRPNSRSRAARRQFARRSSRRARGRPAARTFFRQAHRSR